MQPPRGVPTPRPPPGPPRVHQRRRFRRRSERRRRPVWCQPTRTVRRHHHAGRHAKRAKSGQIPHDDFRTRLKSHLESSDLKLDEAPSAHRTPLCVFVSLPTYTTLSWRSRKNVIVWRRRRRLLRVCIDGRDGGPRGFEPRAAKIDRSPHLTWAHRRLLTQLRRLLMPPSSNARTRTAHPSSAGNMDGGSRRAGACA